MSDPHPDRWAAYRDRANRSDTLAALKTEPGDGAEHRCQATRADGEPCRATPRRGRPWCFAHDPELETERSESRRRGGRERWRRHLREIEGSGRPFGALLSVLTETIAALQRPGVGLEETARLRAVIYGVSVAGRLVEASELERKLDEVHDMLAALPGFEIHARGFTE